MAVEIVLEDERCGIGVDTAFPPAPVTFAAREQLVGFGLVSRSSWSTMGTSTVAVMIDANCRTWPVSVVGLSVEAPRQADDDRGESVVFRAEPAGFIDELLRGAAHTPRVHHRLPG